MDLQDLRNLQEAYMEVVENQQLDEKSVSWDTGRNASGMSPRDAAASRQAQFQRSSNPADQVRASQIGAVRTNMRSSIQQTGTTSPNRLRSAGPIASKRFKNAAIRQRGGSPDSVPIRTVPGLRDANEPAQTRRRKTQKEQADLYDIILSHLLDEGYANTVESAEAIMVNMSEDWAETIVEKSGEQPLPYGHMMKKSNKLASSDDKKKQNRAAHIYLAANAPMGPKVKIHK